MVEYIHEDFKSIINYEKLCNEKLIFFKRGGRGAIFLYKNKLVKKTIVSKKICNEVIVLKKINEYMDENKIPELFSRANLIYKCKTANFSTYSQFYNPKRNYKAISNNYIFILDKYESNSIYKELRILQKNNDILKIKSLMIMLLIGLWHLNHTLNIFHDDMCIGKKLKYFNNVLLEKTSNKNMPLEFGKKKINIKLYGYKIRIIDFGLSCFKDVYLKQNIRGKPSPKGIYTSINRFYNSKPLYKKIKFRSEIIFIIRCFFMHWNIENLDEKMVKYYSKFAKKNKTIKKFDEEIIYDIYKNFEKLEIWS